MSNPDFQHEKTSVHSEELSQQSEIQATSDVEQQKQTTDINTSDTSTTTTDGYPHGVRLAAIVISIMLSTFLGALDNTILGTTIPKITDEFHELDKVSWYAAAYFMTYGGFQSTWGKFYKYFPIKTWFLVAMFIFELGSLLCGVAPNPSTLIAGRAIAGVGSAGVTAGAFTIIGFAARPEKRPQLMGITGATYGIAAVLGPLLGGVFADRVTWRWVRCFYINLPIGGLAATMVFFFFKTPEEAKAVQATRKEKMLQMDFIGSALVICLIVSYLLALQYGGQTKPWSSPTVIGLLVCSFVNFMICVLWEVSQKERAMIVLRLFKMRHVWVGAVFMFFFAGAYLMILYYLPIYFQNVHNSSPIESGVKMLALVIPSTLTSVVQGTALAIIGIAPLFWIVSGALGMISTGLFHTMDASTATGKWIGYQIIFGVASGLGFQVAISVAQVHAQPGDMSQVTAIIFFFLMVGGAFFVSAAQSAFNNTPIKTLASTAPEISPATLLGTGATQLRSVFTATQVPLVIDAYMAGLKVVFAIAIAAFGVSILVGFCGSWRKLSSRDADTAQEIQEMP